MRRAVRLSPSRTTRASRHIETMAQLPAQAACVVRVRRSCTIISTHAHYMPMSYQRFSIQRPPPLSSNLWLCRRWSQIELSVAVQRTWECSAAAISEIWKHALSGAVPNHKRVGEQVQEAQHGGDHTIEADLPVVPTRFSKSPPDLTSGGWWASFPSWLSLREYMAACPGSPPSPS